MDSSNNRAVMSSSSVTLKNSDFFDQPPLTSGQRSDILRRSSRSESGTVINKSIGNKSKASSNVHDFPATDADAHKNSERVTDIVDGNWTGDRDHGDDPDKRRQTIQSAHDHNIMTNGRSVQLAAVDHSNCPVMKINVVKVGIYGWRKKFLYLLILSIALLVFINAALLYWIMQLLNINQDGLGNLKVSNDGIIVDGHSFIGGQLFAAKIRSQSRNRIKIYATDELTIHGHDGGGHSKRDIDSNGKSSILTMDNKSIEVAADRFIVRSGQKIMFVADPNQVIVSSDTLRINNSMAIKLNKSLVTRLIRGTVSADLDIISPTRTIRLSAPEGINVQSSAGRITVNSLHGTRFVTSSKSSNGKIILDSKDIFLKNVPTIRTRSSSSGNVLVPSIGRGKRYNGGNVVEQADLEHLSNGSKSSESPESDDDLNKTSTISYPDGTNSNRTLIQGLDMDNGVEDNISDPQDIDHGPDRDKSDDKKNEVYQLCICSNGQIFMVPSESSCLVTELDNIICS